MRRLAVLAPLALLAAILVARWRRALAQAPLDAAPERSTLGPRPAALGAAVDAATSADEALDPPPDQAPAAPSPFLSVPWTLEAAADDRAELTLRCRLAAGLALDRVDVQETPTQVFVTALARQETGEAVPSTTTTATATVPLSEPLGARELIPAPVDEVGDADAPAGTDAPPPPL